MPRRPAAALALVLWPALLWAGHKPLPPAPYSYVYNEGVVSPSAEKALGLRLRALQEGTGHQFVVGLFSSLDGESLEDYANRLFRAWAPGAKKGDDGLLFCLFKKDRRWRVEVGYGLEATLTDLEASAIAEEAGSSRLKAGDYDAAALAVVDGLSTKLITSAKPRRTRALALEPIPSWLPLLGAGVLLLLAALGLMAGAASRPTIGRRAATARQAEAAVDILDLLFRILWMILSAGSRGSSGGGSSGGGFVGGGGSSGGGGASGSW